MKGASKRQPELDQLLGLLRPALEASLDPVCILNSRSEIVLADAAMRALLRIRVRDLRSEKLCFCDLLKLSACEGECRIAQVIETGKALRLDEVPATLGERKIRLSLKAVPLQAPDAAAGARPIGVLVTLRDSTAEILLQAKYHKLLALVQAKEDRIVQLKDRIETLLATLRHARSNSAA